MTSHVATCFRSLLKGRNIRLALLLYSVHDAEVENTPAWDHKFLTIVLHIFCLKTCRVELLRRSLISPCVVVQMVV